ncbi:MAG: hypothetical protein LBC40_07475 [Dysgonamonadaceae bacterium]|jgi:hypothetical protein|nr:hypothetical protein [Dysgonamonadaceae bacterium]
MNREQNKTLAEKVLNNIPQEVKPVNYLMDTLEIGKESAYRRIRGEIPFTFDEITKLSLALGFSMDEMVGQDQSDRVFFELQTRLDQGPDEAFWTMLKEYYNKIMKKISKARDMEAIVSLNRLSLIMYIKYNLLFKFAYYRWIHQLSDETLNLRFAEMQVPREIVSVQQDFKSKLRYVRNCYYILDRNLFLPIVREIQYYYHRKLITSEEVWQLQEELRALLHSLEELMQKGVDGFGNIVYLHLSSLGIESNTAYIMCDGKCTSQYWIYHVNAVILSNWEVCSIHKKWLEALKKHSELITRSNEMLQAEFLETQKNYIESINNNFNNLY